MELLETIELTYREYLDISPLKRNDDYFYTLREYKDKFNLEDIGITNSNRSDAQLLAELFENIPIIQVNIERGQDQIGYYNYRVYPESILYEYFGAQINEALNGGNEFDFINKKHHFLKKFSISNYKKLHRNLANFKSDKVSFSILEFYYWILNNSNFHNSYYTWLNTGSYLDKPSIRILNKSGICSLENLELTTVQNSSKRGRRVGQYTIEGEFIKEFYSIVNAALETNSRKKGIEKVLYGEQKTHNGFKWAFLDESKRDYSNRSKLIGQYNRDGVLLNTYKSRKEASESINSPVKGIGRALTGERKSAYGYIWRYLPNEPN